MASAQVVLVIVMVHMLVAVNGLPMVVCFGVQVVCVGSNQQVVLDTHGSHGPNTECTADRLGLSKQHYEYDKQVVA